MIDINGTLLVQIIQFLILVAILAKFCYKPLLAAMKARQDRIAGELKQAEDNLAEAEEAKKKYLAELAKAQTEAQAIIEKAVKTAEAERQAQMKELKEQLVREKEQAQQIGRAHV